MRTGFSIDVCNLKHGDAVISGEIALLIQDDPITVEADLLKALFSGEDVIESANIHFVLTGRAKFAAEIGKKLDFVPNTGIQPTELNAPLGHISVGLGYGIVFRVPVDLVVDTAKIDIKGTLNFGAELDIAVKMSSGPLPSGGKGWAQAPSLGIELVSTASNESTVAFFDASADATAKLRAGIAATPMLTVIGMSEYLHL